MSIATAYQLIFVIFLVSQAFSSFRGQQLSRRSLKHVLSNKTERLPVGVARSHSHHHHPTPTPGVPPTGAEDGAFLDDMSRFVYKKISAALQPYLPKDIDYLDWLPEGIHSKLHNSEAAVSFLDELMYLCKTLD